MAISFSLKCGDFGWFLSPKKILFRSPHPPFFLLPTGEISQQIFFHPHIKPIFQTIIKKKIFWLLMVLQYSQV